MQNQPITNSQDIIDSRDIIVRIESLESDLEVAELDSDKAEELDSLRNLAEEADGADDWHHGETLIRDSYFETYAREFAEDIGAIDPNAIWPVYCIDWERAARELQVDYTSVEFNGVTYWIRY